MRKAYLILLLLILPFFSFTQTYYFEGYGVQNGLAQSNVSGIIQDNDGYYWIATESGISKFDGKNFINYTSENGLGDNNITALLYDQNGTMWMGHDNGILSIYRDKKFSHTSIKNIGAGKKIYSLFQDSKNKIWLATNNGAFVINDFNSASTPVSYSSAEGLSPIVFAIQEFKNEMWFLTDVGIKKLNQSTHTFEFVKINGLPPVQITAFLVSHKNEILVGTSAGSIYKISSNFSSAELIFDIRLQGNTSAFASNFIYTIDEDSDGNFWASIFNSGVCKISNDNKTAVYNTSNGLPVNKIKCISSDREGNILLGTVGEGLQVFKGELFTSFSKNDGLSNSQIFSICSDKDKNILFGTNAGISVYHPSENENKIVNIGVIGNSPVNNVRSIAKDKNGNIFVGLWGGKVLSMQNGNFNPVSGLSELINPYVSCMITDHANNLWIGTVDGLTKYNCTTGEIKSYRTVDGLCSNDITCIYEDTQHKIWIGTKQKGITIIDKNTFTQLNKEKGLGNNNITCIGEDAAGNTWIGTEGGGIDIFDNHQCKNISVTNGLLSNYITLVAYDKKGYVWIGTNKGLCRYNCKDNTIRAYLKGEGFTGIETKLNAVFEDEENNFWFGTVNGAFKYQYDELKEKIIDPLIRITALKVNLKETDYSKPLSLSYRENSLTFEYIAITLRNNDQLNYKIKLEGFDDDWRPATRENSVTYSNLPPGKYEFLLQACDAAGKCTTSSEKLLIYIQPPFWKTWWFYALSALVIVFSLFAYIKIRERNLIQEKKILEEKVEERTAEVVQKNKELDEKNKDITASIRYAKRIQDAILPPDDFVRTYLPKTFILFKPKDIVSGDFYWLNDKKDMVLFAAVDCTGHGVPGAFMSIVGHSKLDQIVGEHDITTPSEILNELNKSVSETLRQSYAEDNSVKDGMDIALCAFNRKTNIMQYAGAYNPLWLIRNGELIEYKADKFPIGNLKAGENKKFTNHAIPLIPGDTLYIYSDGFADQFGGTEGKKFKYSAFKKLLLENQHLSMEEQGELLNETIENWRGKLEQVDDILVIGTRL